MAPLRAAVLLLSAENRRGGSFCPPPPPSARVKTLEAPLSINRNLHLGHQGCLKTIGNLNNFTDLMCSLSIGVLRFFSTNLCEIAKLI